MSVLVSNPSVASPSNNNPQPNADAATLTPARSPSGSSNISFGTPQNEAGPVFSGTQTKAQDPMGARGAANNSFPASYPNTFLSGLIGQLQGFLHKLQSMLNPFRPGPGYGRPEPSIPLKPLPGHCRPTHCQPEPGYGRPDPRYSSRTHDQLGDLLKNNFDAFKAPGKSYITKQSLEDMAGRRLTGNEDRDGNILLARELLRRPEVVQAFDRAGGTGDLDGRISRQDLDAVLDSDNDLKYQSDKQIAEQMLEEFKNLKGGFWRNSISIDDLKDLAASKLTGNPKRDQLIELAREVTQRSSLLDAMDRFGSGFLNGKIGKDALRWLSR